MNEITFNDLSFTYPIIEDDLDADGNQIIPKPIFEHFSGTIPGGFTSLIGPNGSGKSTFLLLASGRLKPTSGNCTLNGIDLQTLDEEQRNLMASVIFQNMEFETEDKVGELLNFVYINGALKGNSCGINSESTDFLDEVKEIFELNTLTNRNLTHLSKGEIQRVLLAFSLLYGSKTVFMDEPLFAMEQYQKENALEYIKNFSIKTGTSIYICMHELDLTRKYAQNVMLFFPDRTISLGTPEEVLINEDLEKAYGFPASMLKSHEDLNTKALLEAEAVKNQQSE